MDQYNPQEVVSLIEDEVKKAVTNTSYTFAPPSRSIFAPENLEPEIKILVPVTAPVRRIFPRSQGYGQAAGWQSLTSRIDNQAGGTGTSVGFVDAGTPNQTTQTYVFKSAPYKNLGRDVAIGRQAIASNRGRNVEDLRAHEERIKMIEVMLGEEDMILNGDSALDPTQFDGLAKTIVTNSGTTGFLTASGIASYTQGLVGLGADGGAQYLVCSYRQARALSDSLAAGNTVQRITTDSLGRAQAGVHVQEVVDQTTGNVIQIVPSRYCGLWAYLLNVTSPAGDNWLEMQDVESMSIYDVPISTHAIQSRVYETTVFLDKAELFQYKIAVGA